MASARLAMALRKDDDDASPPAFPPSLPPADSTAIKLRKSSLIGVMTWEAMLEKLDLNSKHDYTTCVETILKMLANVLASPSDPKYRKIRVSNPNFVAKVLSAKGAPECFQLAGFTETIEAGFLVLPEGADLVNVQRALDALNSHAEGRAQAEEKKRKLELERAARAREERSRKARDERPSEIISEMDMAMMAQHEHRVRDEDEAMVEAIESYFEEHPERRCGRALDSYSIERQVPGPGHSVVASVCASAGTSYFDYRATMTRGAGGAWAVLKVEEA